MGYASYLENIKERLQRSLGKLQRSKHSTRPSSFAAAQVRAIIKEAQKVLEDFKNLSDLATSPELNLADELKRLRAENELLKKRVSDLERQAQSQEDTKLALERAKNEIRKLEEERNHLIAE